MGRVDGKVVLITGAARGQGRSHAVTLAAEGASIIAIDICDQIASVPYAMATQADLDETVRLVEALDRRCLGIKADCRSSEQMKSVVDAAIAEFGRIDILSVNHGIFSINPWDEVTGEEWDDTIATDLTGVWRATRPVIPHMIEQGAGAIVFTSSGAGLSSVRRMGPYLAAKHGVIGLMRWLAAELAPHWIRVNAICPGNVATPMVHNPQVLSVFSGGKADATVDDAAFAAQAMSLLPIPWLQPEDISRALLFLACDEARYITSFAMPVDAGYLIQPPGIPPIAIERITELRAAQEAS
jgi:SDR family mycofactocin-dependent oxidoreductase